jgi:alcohol dehydrogenase YqhD (iron-dependent ADH family)
MDFANPEKTALEGIDALQNYLCSLGMPKNFEELGANKEDIPKLVNVLCRTSGRNGSISGFVTLNEEDCTKIYEMMV